MPHVRRRVIALSKSMSPGGARLLWLALAAILAATFAPLEAHASGLLPSSSPGISLGWQDCRTGDGLGALNQNFACAISINDLPMFPALVLAAPIDSVLSAEIVIDVEVATDSLPSWWHMEPGGCHSVPTGWTASLATTSTCADPWGGAGSASVQGWLVGTPGGSARHARLLVAVGGLPSALVTLQAGVAYSLSRIAVRSDNSLTCEGCSVPACLVFNSVLVRRLPGSTPESVVFSTPEVAGRNMVVWQAGTGADCQAVPTRRSTWGAVKALYR